MSRPPMDQPESAEAHLLRASQMRAADRRIARRSPSDLSLNLTSMIDVVFLLLVYFMVATQFKTGEEIYRLDLPERGAGAPADPFDLPDEPLRIRVDTTGLPDPAYRVRLDGPWPQPAGFADLRTWLEANRIGAGGPGALFAEDHPIIVDPAPNASWQHAMDAFNCAAAAGYIDITFGESGP